MVDEKKTAADRFVERLEKTPGVTVGERTMDDVELTIEPGARAAVVEALSEAMRETPTGMTPLTIDAISEWDRQMREKFGIPSVEEICEQAKTLGFVSAIAKNPKKYFNRDTPTLQHYEPLPLQGGVAGQCDPHLEDVGQKEQTRVVAHETTKSERLAAKRRAFHEAYGAPKDSEE